ncbi:MAG: WbqC family protein [Thermoanaerobaculia bacterium]
MRKRVAIVQSNYIPWRGYFDLIALADEFILLDDVQYTRRDWRNRNRIKTANGLAWLSIPVLSRGNYHANIRDIEIDGRDWAAKHLSTIALHYRRAACADQVMDLLVSLYDGARELSHLTDVNHVFLTGICRFLGIDTPIRRSGDFAIESGRNERLVSLCRQIGASIYLSGPSARSYLDETLFRAEGVEVEYADYSGYPEYRQQFPPFEHGVSIVDLLMNEGADAPRFMKHVLERREHR